jgi:UDP-glucose 4-epimerase
MIMSGSKGVIGKELSVALLENCFNIVNYEDFNVDDKYAHSTFLHLAAKTDTPNNIINSNIIFLRECLEFSIKNKIKNFVLFSAMSVYGSKNELNIDENSSICNPDLYGASKLFAEKLLYNYKNDIRVLILRLPGVLSNKGSDIFLERVYRKMNSNKDIAINNGEKIFNNMIGISSITNFLIDYNYKSKYEVYNLAGKQDSTLFEVISLIKQMMNSDSNIRCLDDKVNFFNISTKKAESTSFIPSDTNSLISEWLTSKIK